MPVALLATHLEQNAERFRCGAIVPQVGRVCLKRHVEVVLLVCAVHSNRARIVRLVDVCLRPGCVHKIELGIGGLWFDCSHFSNWPDEISL